MGRKIANKGGAMVRGWGVRLQVECGRCSFDKNSKISENRIRLYTKVLEAAPMST